LGETINEVMNKHFPEIVDTNFTAEMERKLDDVEEGRRSWIEFLRSFYGDFKVVMEKAEAEMNRVQKPLEEIDELCPECGRNLVIRTGRYGRFISCSGFPECRYGRSFVNKTGALCPVCHADLVERKTRQKKRVFYGCNNYPTCNFAIWERPVPDLCPRCGGLMVIPKPGQDPVCYQEVIAVQRDEEAKPQQDGQAKTQRTTRKKTVSAEVTMGETADAEPGTPRRSPTATKKKATVTETETDAVADRTKVAVPLKKTSTRTTTAKKPATRGTSKRTPTARKTTTRASSPSTEAPGAKTTRKKSTTVQNLLKRK
jgi:DNA topoisomerase-1